MRLCCLRTQLFTQALPGEIFIYFELIGLAETCPEITLAKNLGLAYRDIGA